MQRLIDLRSDACSSPTVEMRQAMFAAQVGNDDFGEDPTVRRLEEASALLLGKESALFVQSGTMANLVAVMTQVDPGQTVLLSRHFHQFDFEEAAMRRVARCDFQFLADATTGCHTRLLLPTDEDANQFSAARLLSIENSVNRLGGTLLEVEHLRELRAWANRHGKRIHLDGARLLNASVALGATPAEIAEHVDTVMMVFTKALAAPAGAVLAGNRETIERARRYRWMLGGGWKQGGLVAAACLVGLETLRGGIFHDHQTARALAEGLAAIPGLRVELDRVCTNIVFLEVGDRTIDLELFQQIIESRGARIGRFKADRRCRLVTHRDIVLNDVERFVEWTKEAVACIV